MSYQKTDPKLLSDLEIFDKVIPAIDKTITVYGKAKFKELFQTVYCNPANLMRRRELLTTLSSTNKKNIRCKNSIINNLNEIHGLEDDITWLFTQDDSDYKDMCFSSSRDYLNVEEVLTARNFLKIYSPLLLILVYFLIYLVLRYKSININLKDYFSGIYNGYKIFITFVLGLMMNNFNLISLLTNILATTYVMYQIYQIYNVTDTSITHYQKCKSLKAKFSNIKKFIVSVKNIYKNDIFLLNEKKLLVKNLNEINRIFSSTKINSVGSIILLKKTCSQYEIQFNSVLQYVGIVDSFISVSKLVNSGFTFPNFDFNKDYGPYVIMKDTFRPDISNVSQRQILNDFHLGNYLVDSSSNINTMILTGPNTSGKSTYIRNVMLAILMAQTLGVTCCKELTFTPFNYLFTYIDIPNIARTKESLFEAEIMRCIDYCNIVENLNKDEYIFTVIDELFTGTNPKEGVAASYGVCEYLAKFTNNLMIVTTHFTELTQLEAKYPDRFKNMKFPVVKTENGSYYRPYKIQTGVSDQNIAIELLALKGYSNDIVKGALSKLDEITNKTKSVDVKIDYDKLNSIQFSIPDPDNYLGKHIKLPDPINIPKTKTTEVLIKPNNSNSLNGLNNHNDRNNRKGPYEPYVDTSSNSSHINLNKTDFLKLDINSSNSSDSESSISSISPINLSNL